MYMYIYMISYYMVLLYFSPRVRGPGAWPPLAPGGPMSRMHAVRLPLALWVCALWLSAALSAFAVGFVGFAFSSSLPRRLPSGALRRGAQLRERRAAQVSRRALRVRGQVAALFVGGASGGRLRPEAQGSLC